MSKLNRNVRYLVLNRTNQVIAPKAEMLSGFNPADLKARGELSKKFSPSIKSEAVARGFGAALAAKYPGQRFYLAKVISGCVVEPATGPWQDTGTALHDEMTVDSDEDDLGTDDNE